MARFLTKSRKMPKDSTSVIFPIFHSACGQSRDLRRRPCHTPSSAPPRVRTAALVLLAGVWAICLQAGLGGSALAAVCSVTISPGASINSTLSAVGAGAVVCLNDGNYGQGVKFPKSGTAAAWITLTAVHPNAATVNSVDINNQSYIEVDNLHVTGGTDLGISAQGGHHTRVIGNLVENMPGGGINLNSGDYRTIEGNVVRGCSAGTSGNTSAISIWEPAALDTAPGYHNYIGYNTVYGNHDPVGGTDGNGIIFDDANGTQVSHVVYLGGALIEENLVWDNGGAGIKVYQSQNALVRNNTAYWNNSFNSNGATLRGEIQNENG